MTGDPEKRDGDDPAIATFMHRVAALPVESVLPEAAQLWWKAELLRRLDADRRAQRPLDFIQPIEAAGGIAAAVVLLFLSFLRLL